MKGSTQCHITVKWSVKRVNSLILTQHGFSVPRFLKLGWGETCLQIHEIDFSHLNVGPHF